MSEIISNTATVAIIASDVKAYKADSARYEGYVKAAEVTSENMPAHVKAFRDAFKVANPDADGDEVKAYATKVRNGLRRWVAKNEQPAKQAGTENLLTSAGVENLNGKTDEEILLAVKAEIANRAK